MMPQFDRPSTCAAAVHHSVRSRKSVATGSLSPSVWEGTQRRRRGEVQAAKDAGSALGWDHRD